MKNARTEVDPPVACAFSTNPTDANNAGVVLTRINLNFGDPPPLQYDWLHAGPRRTGLIDDRAAIVDRNHFRCVSAKVREFDIHGACQTRQDNLRAIARVPTHRPADRYQSPLV